MNRYEIKKGSTKSRDLSLFYSYAIGQTIPENLGTARAIC